MKQNKMQQLGGFLKSLATAALIASMLLYVICSTARQNRMQEQIDQNSQLIENLIDVKALGK